MRALTIIIVFGTLLLFTPSPSHAIPFTFTATLNGTSENPPNNSPGTGSVSVVLDNVLHTLSITGAFQNLLGTTTDAHIHCCVTPPTNIGIATRQQPPGFPLGVTSGAFAINFNTLDSTPYSAAFITNFGGGTAAGAEIALLAGLQAGQAYFNIHSATSDPTRFPGGEIRGLLGQVPEAGTVGLLLIGLGALGTTAWVLRERVTRCR